VAKVHFDDTVIDYRDDNRHLWRFIEEGDEEESFDPETQAGSHGEETVGLPPRHYPEWDCQPDLPPDWVSVYEALHPAAAPPTSTSCCKSTPRWPSSSSACSTCSSRRTRCASATRRKAANSISTSPSRSLIDFKSGAPPDPRINMSHRTDGRDISVLLLLDLSQSLNETLPGSGQTILDTAQEAVALLGLGDRPAWATPAPSPASIPTPGTRCATTTSRAFPRAGTIPSRPAWPPSKPAGRRAWAPHAPRRPHADGTAHAEKRILLVLTDGEPADIDVSDPHYLIADAKKAVEELSTAGITTFCLSLDPKADAYVGDIFGKRWRVLDRHRAPAGRGYPARQFAPDARTQF
jgi:nitric oxide reductase NorD protein